MLKPTHETTFSEGVALNYNIATEELHFRVLAPTAADVPHHFTQRCVDDRLHESLINDTQLVRGLALRECGPTGANLLPDGRHFQPVDAESWHILLQNSEGRILGCARYRPLGGGADQVGASHSALSASNRYGPVLKSSIERLITDARKRKKACGEVGGWALRKEIRGSTAAINIAAMTCALAEHLGCGLGITTATRMHHSSAMLCRMGARRLAEVPAYYEPRYGSIIEVLHFDFPNANTRYAARLNKAREEILKIPVVCARQSSRSIPRMLPMNLMMPMPEMLMAQ